MDSVAVSKLGKTDLVFVQSGAKINSVYYCENVLEQKILDIRHAFMFFILASTFLQLWYRPQCLTAGVGMLLCLVLQIFLFLFYFSF